MCPALMTPHIYGLLSEPPGDEAQRHLVLLSKILQSLANNTLPGQKENYMERMNEFITSNQQTLQKFFDQITVPENINGNDMGNYVTIPRHLHDSALAFMHHHIYRQFHSISTILAQWGDQDTSDQLNQVMGKLGEPRYTQDINSSISKMN